MNKEFWKNKKVLVTGGSGFIGSHLIVALRKLGAEIYATENDHSVKDAHKVFSVDLRNKDQVEFLCYRSRFDIVFHLASQAIVRSGNDFSRQTLETNVGGTINLLESIFEIQSNVLSIVVASTDKVYGRHENLPYHEDFSHRGNHQIYEVSKLCEDNIAQAYFHSMNLPISITRFGNVYGPGDRHWSRLIPGTILSFLQDKSPFIRSDGQHYRDYVYIDDVIDGYLRLAEWRANNPDNYHIAVNFGTGRPSRVLDVIGMIASHFPKGKACRVMYGAEDEIHRQYLDYSLAHKLFGWSPKTSLVDGINSTVLWYKDNIK